MADIHDELKKTTHKLVFLLKYIKNVAREAACGDDDDDDDFAHHSIEMLHASMPESLNEDLFDFMSQFVAFEKTLRSIKMTEMLKKITD